jgi:hypothetical protein
MIWDRRYYVRKREAAGRAGLPPGTPKNASAAKPGPATNDPFPLGKKLWDVVSSPSSAGRLARRKGYKRTKP